MPTAQSDTPEQPMEIAGLRPVTRLGHLLGIVLLAAAWFLAALLGGLFTAPGGVPAILWPPCGVALAALLLFGRGLWPGIVIGAAAAFLWMGLTPAHAGLLTIVHLTEALIAFSLLRRADFSINFTKTQDSLALLALGALLAPLAGTLIMALGVMHLPLGGAPTAPFWESLRIHWLSDALGVLILTPLLLAWATTRDYRPSPPRVIEAVLLLISTLLAAWSSFSWVGTPHAAAYPFIIFPFVIWSALRFRHCGAATATLLIVTIAISGTLNNWGVFAWPASPYASATALQAFLGIISVTGLLLAATAAERADSLNTLRDSESRYRALFENNPHPMFVFNPVDGQIRAINAATRKRFGYDEDSLTRHSLDEIIEGELPRETLDRMLADSDSHTFQQDLTLLTEDGESVRCRCTARTVTYSGERACLLLAEDVTEQIRTRDTLHDLEQKLTLHMQQTALGVIEWTPDFRIIEWNPAAENIFGFRADEVRGRSGEIIVPESAREHVMNVWNMLTTRKGGDQSTNENITKDGRSIVCEWFNTPLIDRQGKVIGVQSVINDITTREYAEEALRESEEKFRNIIESSPMGIHIFDLRPNDDLVLIGANAAADRILGIDHRERLGQPIQTALPMLAETDIPGRYREVARTGNAWHADHVTYVGRDLAGAYEVTAFRTSPGKVVAMLLDVTERRRTEEALRLREKAMEAITQGIVIQSNSPESDHPVIYANPAFKKISGYAEPEIIGRNLKLLFGRETGSEERAEYEEALFEKRSSVLDLQLYRKNGHAFLASLSVSPIRNEDGNVAYFVTVLTDVSSIRKLESQFRQSQKMEAIGRLAGGVAHDFNNLLTAIIGYNDLVLAGLPEDSPLKENVREIHRAAERASTLTGQLLSFSRQQSLQPEVVDVNEIVTGLQKMLGRLIGEDIEIRTELSDLAGGVKCEPGQLEQVIMNMVINARDAMEGRGTLTIHTGLVAVNERMAGNVAGFSPGSYVILAITDTGCGMTREVREHLFEPFFTTKEKGKGTGLGLATCYGIVKQSGGDIRVQSEVGKGTTFEILLPAADPGRVRPGATERSESRMGGDERVLVVEDDMAVRPLTTSILESLGYTVVEAVDGTDAVRIIEGADAFDFDLVLTDVVMPNMGGKELAEWIRSRHADVRILFTSGYIESPLSRTDLGGNERFFLQKPFTPMALARKVRAILDQSPAT